MPSLKKIAKSVLASVGLLTLAQKHWRHHRLAVEHREIAELYRQFISPGDLCLDVGANVGDISEVMLKLGAKVVAVEPQGENVQVLQERLSGHPNFVLIPKAVASEVGCGQLMVCQSSDCSSMSPEFVAAVTGSGRLPADLYKWEEVRQVQTTTLDEIIAEYGVPAFAKVDVEGFEVEVLKGCSQKLKLLSLEFTPERLQSVLTCIEILERLGPVEFNYTLERRRILKLPKWVSGADLAHKLQTTHFPIVVGPAGELYARFTQN